MLRAWLYQMRKNLLGSATPPRLARRRRCVHLELEALEERTLLTGPPITGYSLDSSGNLYNTSGSQPQLIDTGVVNFTVMNNQVFDLHVDNTLQVMGTNGSGKGTVATNVQTLIQSHHSNGAPVLTVLANRQMEQSDDGIHFSTIPLDGPITQIAAGQNSTGQQVLCALRADGQLSQLDAAGEHFPLAGVQTLIQSYHSNWAPVITVLQGGHLEQADDGIHFSTIDLGAPIIQLAQGTNAASQQLLYALRSDDTLLEDAPSGVSGLASGVQTLIQSRSGYGMPVPLFLHNGLFQETTDGTALSTIDLRGTITALTPGCNAAGQQVIYALRSDGVLFVDAPSGVSTVNLGGAITQIAAGQDGTGQPILCALRQDGQLIRIDSAGEQQLSLAGVQTLIQSYHTGGAPVVTILQGGYLQQADDGIHFSTIDLDGRIIRIAAGQDSMGQQVLYALRSDNVLFADTAAGVTLVSRNVVAWGFMGPQQTLVYVTYVSSQSGGTTNFQFTLYDLGSLSPLDGYSGSVRNGSLIAWGLPMEIEGQAIVWVYYT
jgi:hypothetical protein